MRRLEIIENLNEEDKKAAQIFADWILDRTGIREKETI
jgi:hypothetical protein